MGSFVNPATKPALGTDRLPIADDPRQDLILYAISKSLSELSTSCDLLPNFIGQLIEHLDIADRAIDELTNPLAQQASWELVSQIKVEINRSMSSLYQLTVGRD